MASNTIHDFNRLDRDAKVEIPVEIDEPIKINHDPHEDHDYSCSNFNLSRVWLHPLEQFAEAIKT